MRLHYFQHEPIETPGNILNWAQERRVSVSSTLLYRDDRFPELEDFDWLVIMGGSMSINDESRHRWLAPEKRFVESAINSGKKILGVCFGAQLVANVLGAKVIKQMHKELGWFPVRLTGEALNKPVCRNIPSEVAVFHWHGERFDLPKGAIHLAESDACINQAFQYGENVLAWQFHPEVTVEMVQAFITVGREEITRGPFIQSEEEMLSCREMTAGLVPILNRWLENFFIND